ncbi:MAG: Nicotinate phosphoribosyltransferase pncB2 [Firmicutes bacterium ADurb.Bin456]|nr:MAG: Nicotinate phosphoribosyltransferase pncB2 [Firmicutes bacterium ADurb.Bin456]
MLQENLTLSTDKYQINMMYAYWRKGVHNKKSVFEAFFRKQPFNNGFAVFAGLERIAGYINNLRFNGDDIAYLAEQEENYDPAFYEELRNFRFTGNIRAVPEGTLVFPGEPLVQVEARLLEAQLVETAILNFMNYQTLVATKAARVRQVAPSDVLMEFGMRRAQEADAALWGARATYIAGFDSTSNMMAGKLFGIPTRGTHAHSWVQKHDSEEEAFKNFADAFPDHVILLVDTYDTIKTGVPNAIKIGKYLESLGKRMRGIRLDSGDLAELSIQARRMLDEAGLDYVKIVASNDLDEYRIEDLKKRGAKIDMWGIGTRLITCYDDPALGGIYKLVAKEVNGSYQPVIKISGSLEKVTTPGVKTIYRMLNKDTGWSEGDYIGFVDEEIMSRDRGGILDPERFEAVELPVSVFKDGQQVYELPSLDGIKAYHKKQLAMFRPEYLRKNNPKTYAVYLSEHVQNTKMDLLRQHNLSFYGDA